MVLLGFILFLSGVFLYGFGYTHAAPSQHTAEVVTDSTIRGSRPSELKLAAWNIRILSDRSRDDAELNKIAQNLINYDFIAISELRDEKVLKRLRESSRYQVQNTVI